MKSNGFKVRSLFLPNVRNYYFCLKNSITRTREKCGSFETECFLYRVSALPAAFNVSLTALVASLVFAAAVLSWGL